MHERSTAAKEAVTSSESSTRGKQRNSLTTEQRSRRRLYVRHGRLRNCDYVLVLNAIPADVSSTTYASVWSASRLSDRVRCPHTLHVYTHVRRIVWRAPLVTEFSTVVRYRPRRIMAYANWVDKKNRFQPRTKVVAETRKIYISSSRIPFTLTRRGRSFPLSSRLFPRRFPRFCFALSTVPFFSLFPSQSSTTYVMHVTLRRIISQAGCFSREILAGLSPHSADMAIPDCTLNGVSHDFRPDDVYVIENLSSRIDLISFEYFLNNTIILIT